MDDLIRTHLDQPGTKITQAQYDDLYQQSIDDPNSFWANQAEHYIDWFKPWDQVQTGSLDKGDVRWFPGASLNVCHNCIDRHLPEKANQTAIIWEGDETNESTTLTYGELHEQVCRFANALKKLEVKKGDRVSIYMPMVPEAAIAMLA